MKPWREIAVPHRDVLEGTFQQSEFAADITAVHSGKATKEYQDPIAFFDRTFITEDMRRLLTQVVQRLTGKGGDPVIQLLRWTPETGPGNKVEYNPYLLGVIHG
jgi:predicted AAA+ superfamily ATPase